MDVGCDTCGHLACVCAILKEHEEGCRFRLAAACAVPIECDHGYDVCPQCDPCSCSCSVKACTPEWSGS